MNKYSIFSWFSYLLPIEERFTLIKEAGFDAVMLWWDGKDRVSHPNLARKIGLVVENAHVPSDSHIYDYLYARDYLELAYMRAAKLEVIHEEGANMMFQTR